MAKKVLIAHNHPCRNVQPSIIDMDITHRLNKALNTVGLKLLDHLIVTGHTYYSFASQGKFRN